MLNADQIFVVIDIEADGPAVGLNSMLSLGAVATTIEQEVAQFYRKLTPLEGATQDAETMSWWDKNPKAWQEATADSHPPRDVMTDFYNWVIKLKAEPIFVSSPIGLDYSFVCWYLYRFAPANPFISKKNAIRMLDIRSYVAGVYGFSFNESSRLKWPSTLTKDMPEHTHRAIDDAVGYAFVMRKLMSDRKHKISK